MPKISKILFIFGVIVSIIGFIILYFKNNEKIPVTEIIMKMATYDKNSGKVLELESNQNTKYFGRLQFFTKPNSKNMSESLVCVQQAKIVDKIDLYMPDMGHGSQPPTIHSVDIPKNIMTKASSEIYLGCFKLENMQLFMTGAWQVRVFYHDGYLGVFDIQITE